MNRSSALLPDICRNSSLLLLLLSTQLIIACVWLASQEFPQWMTLGFWSFYIQWLVLLTSFTVCAGKDRLHKYSHFWQGFAFALIFLICLAIVELIAGTWQHGFISLKFDLVRYLRLALAGLIVVVLLLRFFVLLNSLESRNRAEAKSRIDALQSRIQPHFLFNSLNTISELVVTQPQQAEDAIQALSMLFRVSLEEGKNTHSLAKELRLCERYVDLEMWRISDNTEFDWTIEVSETTNWVVPKLMLQPLIENAIKYTRDIASTDKKSVIEISIKEAANYLSLRIASPILESQSESGFIAAKSGNGMALENLKERLIVLYDDQQSLRVKRRSSSFEVTIRIPM